MFNYDDIRTGAQLQLTENTKLYLVKTDEGFVLKTISADFFIKKTYWTVNTKAFLHKASTNSATTHLFFDSNHKLRVPQPVLNEVDVKEHLDIDIAITPGQLSPEVPETAATQQEMQASAQLKDQSSVTNGIRPYLSWGFLREQIPASQRPFPARHLGRVDSRIGPPIATLPYDNQRLLLRPELVTQVFYVLVLLARAHVEKQMRARPCTRDWNEFKEELCSRANTRYSIRQGRNWSHEELEEKCSARAEYDDLNQNSREAKVRILISYKENPSFDANFNVICMNFKSKLSLGYDHNGDNTYYANYAACYVSFYEFTSSELSKILKLEPNLKFRVLDADDFAPPQNSSFFYPLPSIKVKQILAKEIYKDPELTEQTNLTNNGRSNTVP